MINDDFHIRDIDLLEVRLYPQERGPTKGGFGKLGTQSHLGFFSFNLKHIL